MGSGCNLTEFTRTRENRKIGLTHEILLTFCFGFILVDDTSQVDLKLMKSMKMLFNCELASKFALAVQRIDDF